MESSIFYTIKRMLGIDTSNDAFDTHVLVAINSAIMTLDQLGLTHRRPFRVTGITETWDDLLGNFEDLDGVQAYVYLKTLLMFDPPSNSFLVNSISDQIKELEWRIMTQVEGRVNNDYGNCHTPWDKGNEMGCAENT